MISKPPAGCFEIVTLNRNNIDGACGRFCPNGRCSDEGTQTNPVVVMEVASWAQFAGDEEEVPTAEVTAATAEVTAGTAVSAAEVTAGTAEVTTATAEVTTATAEVTAATAEVLEDPCNGVASLWC